MKTVLAITIVFLGIVFFNCGNSLVNSGKYSPQTETAGKKLNKDVLFSRMDTLAGRRYEN